jgi:hypothetical protein
MTLFLLPWQERPGCGDRTRLRDRYSAGGVGDDEERPAVRSLADVLRDLKRTLGMEERVR